MKKILLLFVALIFVASCSKGGGLGPKGSYVLKVDGTTLSKDDVQAEINSLPDMAKQFFSGPEGTAKFVDELSKKEMLYLEAKKQGLDKNKEFEKRVEDFKKINLINQLLEKEIEATTKVTEKDAQDYYNSHKNEFMMRNEIRLAQIVTKNEEDAQKAYERIRKGEDFAKVATAVSIDKKTAKGGGFMGSMKRGELPPEVEAVVFKMKDGEVSTPIKLKDGYHIFRVIDIKGPVVQFDQVKDMVMHRLTGERQKAAFDKYIDNLKKNYKVEINKDELAKVHVAAPAPAPGQMGQMPAPAPHPIPAPGSK